MPGKAQLGKPKSKNTFSEAFDFKHFISEAQTHSNSRESGQVHTVELKLKQGKKQIKFKSDLALILYLDSIAHLNGITFADVVFWIDNQRAPTDLSINDALTRYVCIFFYMKCHHPMAENPNYNPLGIPPIRLHNRNSKMLTAVMNAYCAELNINPQKFKNMYLNKAKSTIRTGLNYNGFDSD